VTNSKGRLVLVVGPSGAGKDSILRYAMNKFSDDRRFVFSRRCITRETDVAVEDHDSLDNATFSAQAAQGAFALMWQAHGIQYGVRQNIHDHLREGKIVAVNVSRTILEEAGNTYPSSIIVEIAASIETRIARISARGREAKKEILQRVTRQISLPNTRLIRHAIQNDGELTASGEAFCKILAQLAGPGMA
jgi:ribose 1,5-bisphosphokinase